MWIERLEIQGFKRLAQTFEFAAGLTLVIGPNESGKSSLHEALVRALYGFSSSELRKSGDVSPKDRRRPWDNGRPYGLVATVHEKDDRSFRVEWDFEVHTVSVYDAITGESVLGEAPGPSLLHLGLDDFRQVCCLTQDQIVAVSGSETLKNALEEAIMSAGGDVRADEAEDRMKAFLQGLGIRVDTYKATAAGRLRGLEATGDELRARLTETEAEREAIAALAQELAGERGWLEDLVAQERALRRELLRTEAETLEARLEEARRHAGSAAARPAKPVVLPASVARLVAEREAALDALAEPIARFEKQVAQGTAQVAELEPDERELQAVVDGLSACADRPSLRGGRPRKMGRVRRPRRARAGGRGVGACSDRTTAVVVLRSREAPALAGARRAHPWSGRASAPLAPRATPALHPAGGGVRARAAARGDACQEDRVGARDRRGARRSGRSAGRRPRPESPSVPRRLREARRVGGEAAAAGADDYQAAVGQGAGAVPARAASGTGHAPRRAARPVREARRFGSGVRGGEDERGRTPGQAARDAEALAAADAAQQVLEAALAGRTMASLEAAATKSWQAYEEHAAAYGSLPPPGEGIGIDDVRAEARTAGDRVVQLETQIGAREQALPEPAELEEELDACTAGIARIEQAANAVRIARETLTEAATETYKQFAPHLNAALEANLPRITDGRYRSATVDDNLDIHVIAPETGNQVSVEELSRATKDQVFLVQRLEIARLLDPTTGSAPLLLDDPFAHFDDTRLRLGLEVIRDVAAQRQVVLFSEETSLIELAQSVCGACVVIELPAPSERAA